MTKKHQSIQLFNNPFMEKFTHVHPITPLVVWVPVIGVMTWRIFSSGNLDAWTIGALLALGALFWTLFEYVMHRFIFHFDGKSGVARYIVYLFHGIHHDDPVDPSRLVMPPIVSVVLGAIMFGIFRLLLGPTLTPPYFVGFIVGYLCYDYAHFAVHHFTPRTPIGRFLKQYHMVHHFVAQDTRFGVSSPLWDYVFSTVEKRESKTSESAS